jgi:hypothetical protein
MYAGVSTSGFTAHDSDQARAERRPAVGIGMAPTAAALKDLLARLRISGSGMRPRHRTNE